MLSDEGMTDLDLLSSAPQCISSKMWSMFLIPTHSEEHGTVQNHQKIEKSEDMFGRTDIKQNDFINTPVVEITPLLDGLPTGIHQLKTFLTTRVASILFFSMLLCNQRNYEKVSIHCFDFFLGEMYLNIVFFDTLQSQVSHSHIQQLHSYKYGAMVKIKIWDYFQVFKKLFIAVAYVIHPNWIVVFR